MASEAGASASEAESGVIASIFYEIVGSPLNIVLVGIITFLIFKIFKSREVPAPVVTEPELPKLRKDFTVGELKKYDGKTEKRILVAVNGKVFDVTKGKRFYGPGGPYAAFGGHDASRGLASFEVNNVKDEYDDLSDLNPQEMESIREWEMQFTERYDYVGRLLRDDEQPTNYSEEEDEKDTSTADKSKSE